jgi:aminopeptidase N
MGFRLALLLLRMSCLAVAAVLVLTSLPARAQARFDMAITQTHLPKTVLPSRVDLALDLDPEANNFAGQVRIRLRVLKPVPAIVLHAHELQADEATLVQAGGRSRALTVAVDAATQTWRLVPTDRRPVNAGAWTLLIRYRGRVQSTGESLYRVGYRLDGKPANMLATQLQAVNARRLLPVFDEPVFRSVFALQVRAPAALQVLSNMPLQHREAEGTHTRHHFAPTPPMPSYLVAVTVGRFDVLEDTVDGIPLRIFTAPGKREQARWAMQVTRQVLPYFARYFGRPYALPKLDQLAVPGTREGAMEDWGLISYIEDTLLFDPERSDEETRRRVFLLVAHEISHQWFGNLVSAASWNEIWLNEAFATWMENKAAAVFHPEWQVPLRLRRDVDRTMNRDATAATRAIRAGPVSEASVFEVFDGVTYDKGGAVLSMLEDWMGEAAFQRGLASYMAERAYKPATAGDLWAHIGRAAAAEPATRAGATAAGAVAAVAASWTDQPGLPLLSVTQRCEAGQTLVTLRQSRFSAQIAPLPGGPWQIPLRLMFGGQAQALLLQGAEQTVGFAGCEPLPLLANAGGLGYYRVEYEPGLKARLVSAFATLAPSSRVALVSDSHALASAGRQPMVDHLALLGALPRAQDSSRAALFEMALFQWRSLDVAMAGTPAQAPLRVAAHALFGPELDRLGWQAVAGEDGETQTLRADLIRSLAQFDHAPTVAQAQLRFEAALGDAASVAPSMRPAVLFAVGSRANDAQFDAMLEALRGTDRQEVRWNLLQALAATQDPARAQRLLDESLSGRLPNDIGSSVPGTLARNPAWVMPCYDFVVAHWEQYKRLAGDGPFGGQLWLLPNAVAASSDPAMARRLIVDQERLAGAAGASSAQRVAAAIDNRSRLREREAPALAAALRP